MDEQNLEGAGADPMAALKRRVLAAALPNAPFDGWTDALVRTCAEAAGVAPEEARLAFPRGGVDLALFFHEEGDRRLRSELETADLGAMRIRDRISFAVRRRLEIAEERREAVRRAAALFALPVYAQDGARAIWSTADVIWTALGDTSEDLNWYTKRGILAGVYGATALYWLNDESEGRARSWAFLARRIDAVMRFEKLKSAVKKNPIGRMAMAGPDWIAERIRKPGARRGAADEKPIDAPGGA